MSGAAQTPGPKHRGIVANTLFGLLAQYSAAGFTIVLTLYLTRSLGTEGFGLFSLAMSIMGIGLMIADLGLASSAGRFVAETVDGLPRVREVTDATLRMKLLGALVVGGLLALLAPVIADLYDKPDLEGALRVFAISLAFESLIILYTSTFASLRRVALNARTLFIESFVETAASIALVAAGAGVTGAIAGRAIGYATGCLVGVVLLARIVGPPRLRVRHHDRELRGTIARYALPLLVINGAYTLYSSIDALLIGAFLTTDDVGQFTAPLRLIAFIAFIAQAVATAVSPRLAGDDPDVGAFVGGLRFVLIVQAFLVAPMLAWAQPIIRLLLGPEYEEAAGVMQALVPYTYLFGLGPLVAMTVTYLGSAGRRVPIVIASLIVNAVIDVALLPVLGVYGAAIGTFVAFMIYVPAHLRIVRRQLDLDLRPLAVTMGRTLVACGLTAGVLLLIGTRDLAVWQWALGIVAAPVVFVAALAVTGELGADDRAWLRGRLGRR